MGELRNPQFHQGDRVRYIEGSSREGWGEGEKVVLLAPGMVGCILGGPEFRRIPEDSPERGFYQVDFGGTALWIRADRLDRE